MSPIKTVSNLVGMISFSSLILNILWLAGLALPFMGLWNAALAPAVGGNPIGYFQALGILLLWLLLRLAADGVTISAKIESPNTP